MYDFAAERPYHPISSSGPVPPYRVKAGNKRDKTEKQRKMAQAGEWTKQGEGQYELSVRVRVTKKRKRLTGADDDYVVSWGHYSLFFFS